jgi:NADH-quinone oxidoreductase subunit M
MNELTLPWLELAAVIPLLGALIVWGQREQDRARVISIVVATLAFLVTASAWEDFTARRLTEAHDHWDLSLWLTGVSFFSVDELSAPLLPLAALQFLLTILATPKSKVRRLSFPLLLVSESLMLMLFSCQHTWGIVILLALGTLPPIAEIVLRKRNPRAFGIHMALFVGLLAAGVWLMGDDFFGGSGSLAATTPLMLAILLRAGVIPLHCWAADLFENASFGMALLFVAPMPGAYAAARLLLPTAPTWALQTMAFAALVMAVYAGGMALIQREGRRFFCFLFLSQSAVVLVGLESATSFGLTGALCVWLSLALAMTGLALTLRGIEARTGRISLASYHGLYDHAPLLAIFFLISGLASVGFPGTLGFIGSELLVEGAVESLPYVGIVVVLAAALNGIAVMQAFFLIFTGARHQGTVTISARPREVVAALCLLTLLIGGGLYPEPFVHSRHHAAEELLHERTRLTQHLEADVQEQVAAEEHALNVE